MCVCMSVSVCLCNVCVSVFECVSFASLFECVYDVFVCVCVCNVCVGVYQCVRVCPICVRLYVQAALVICGLFICEFAYSHQQKGSK